MTSYSSIGMKFSTLILVGLTVFSALSSSVSAYSSSYRTSQSAANLVDSYVERLQRGGYSTADITSALINLRSTYIKRQKSHQYSGSTLAQIEAIIDELDSAIAWVSEGNCGTCSVYDPMNVYVPPASNNTYYNNPYYNNNYYNNGSNTYYNNNYYNNGYYNNPYYNTNSQTRVSVSTVSTPVDTYNSTQTRTDLSFQNTVTSYRDYDVYTFVPQTNGYQSNQPASSSFLTTSLTRQFSTYQGRTINAYFGAEYNSSRVSSIRSLAENSSRTSQTTATIGSIYSDSFISLSSDNFSQQAVSNGSTKMYRTYRLYVAKDNSHAFIVEYIESGSGIYGRNITGIDPNSFTDFGSYFTHTYTTANNTSKRYKQYIYTPAPGANATNVINNLWIYSRTSYSTSTNRTQYTGGQMTRTTINGYMVTSGNVSTMESTFASYGYSASYVTLPGSNSQISFTPLSNYSFQYSRLSDNTYRMYRLLVAEDGTDAYLTEYVESQPN